jgi:tRNA(Ile)-lysidine synthase
MTIRLPDAPAYLVAFSGGADSRLLLGLTAEVARATGARVCAAHLHHGIRGEEADRDEAFCRRVCAELGVPLFSERVDIPARATASGRSLEHEAREARYDFFTRLMAQENIPVLLTAHHADDNLETVLLRLLRGSGTRGMGGIPYERPLPCRTGNTPYNGTSRRVVRPLLDCTRAEIEAELASRGWDYVTDSTNTSPDHTRNRLRHTVVPTLESIAGEGIPQRCATRLARAAAEDDEALTAIAEAQFAASGDPQMGAIPLSALTSQPPAIAKRILLCSYAAYLRSRGEESVPLHRTLSAYHLDALLTLAREGQAGDVSDELPAGVRATVADDRLAFAADEPREPLPMRDPVPLALGITPWDVPFSVLTEASDTPLAPLTGDGVWTSATFPTSVGELHIRARTTGDTILSHGMHKKIKKLLCDKHIPADLRDRLPLVCLHDGQILWCPAVAFSDGFPPPAEGGCIRISLLKNPEQP